MLFSWRRHLGTIAGATIKTKAERMAKAKAPIGAIAALYKDSRGRPRIEPAGEGRPERMVSQF
jgi:hypothetical protein